MSILPGDANFALVAPAPSEADNDTWNNMGMVKSVQSLHYCGSVIVIEKRPMQKPLNLRTGTPTVPFFDPPKSFLKRLKGQLKRVVLI